MNKNHAKNYDFHNLNKKVIHKITTSNRKFRETSDNPFFLNPILFPQQRNRHHRNRPDRWLPPVEGGSLEARRLQPVLDDQVLDRLRSDHLQGLRMLLRLSGLGPGAGRNRPVLQDARLLLHHGQVSDVSGVFRTVPVEVLPRTTLVWYGGAIRSAFFELVI